MNRVKLQLSHEKKFALTLSGQKPQKYLFRGAIESQSYCNGGCGNPPFCHKQVIILNVCR